MTGPVRSRRRRLRVIAFIAVVSVVASVWLARRGFLVEPDQLAVVAYDIPLRGWPKSLDGFRIAALGDIHAGAPFIDETKLETVVRRISGEKPDLIVWLGDYVIDGVVGGHPIDPERTAVILSKAQSRYGQAAIIGNHDRWLDSERVEKAFIAAGVPFLRWSARTIEVNGTRLRVYGLDDFELSPGYWPKFARAEKEWSGIPLEEPLIVLSHNPDVFPSIPTRVALTLAAHTHGGQVRLPLIGSPVVPSSFGQRFARGVIEERGRTLFVNTGLGSSILPVRLGVPPEISVLTLRALQAN